MAATDSEGDHAWPLPGSARSFAMFCLAKGPQNAASLRGMVTNARSHYRDGALEGVIVRREDKNSLLKCGKLVRADFAQSIDSHWRSRNLEWNRVRREGEPA